MKPLQIEFHIKGKPLPGIDAFERINALLAESQLSAILKPVKEGFVISATAAETEISAFETKLLPLLATHFTLESYAKKRPQSKKSSEQKKSQDPVTQAVSLLKKAKVIAVRTEVGYHLLCNATKIPAVRALRTVIGSEKRALDVVFKSLVGAEKLLLLSAKERELLQEHPGDFVLSKVKTLHQLERTTYKYTLNRALHPLNKRLGVMLSSGLFYKALYSQITFPVVSLDALTSEGEMITSAELLRKHYGEGIAAVIEFETGAVTPRKRAHYQIVYGKPQRFPPRNDPNADVLLTEETTGIFEHGLKPLHLLTSADGEKTPLYTAVSMLFAAVPMEDIAGLDLPFSAEELNALYERWEKRDGTVESDTLLDYFDAITALCRIDDTKEFVTESLWHAENYFEVCEEELFDYRIDKEGISIDLIVAYCVNKKPKYLYSTLTNTISEIIAEIAAETEKERVHLSGTLMGYRDLAELTIEKLEEAGKEAELS